jgi:hypothetical protein
MGQDCREIARISVTTSRFGRFNFAGPLADALREEISGGPLTQEMAVRGGRWSQWEEKHDIMSQLCLNC